MNPLNHVAIIMDGNGRWGLKHKNSRNAGHKAGLNAVEKIIKESIKQKIKFKFVLFPKHPRQIMTICDLQLTLNLHYSKNTPVKLGQFAIYN